jgi:hypothetical protein
MAGFPARSGISATLIAASIFWITSVGGDHR